MFNRNVLALAVMVLSLGGIEGARGQGFYVSPSQRDLVVFVKLAPSNPGPVQAFYQATEFAAHSMATAILGPKYRSVHVILGSQATLSNLASTLNSVAANPSVRAVDMIFVTHGLGSSVYFASSSGNGTSSVTTTALQTYLTTNIPASRREKLRMLFSTACWGSLHRTAWRNVGFKAVSGSRQVYADSALSYAPFLNAWAGYSNFANSVNAANNADPFRTMDTAAAGVLWVSGSPYWDNVESFRNRSGWTTTISLTQQVPGLQ